MEGQQRGRHTAGLCIAALALCQLALSPSVCSLTHRQVVEVDPPAGVGAAPATAHGVLRRPCLRAEGQRGLVRQRVHALRQQLLPYARLLLRQPCAAPAEGQGGLGGTQPLLQPELLDLRLQPGLQLVDLRGVASEDAEPAAVEWCPAKSRSGQSRTRGFTVGLSGANLHEEVLGLL